MSRTEIAARPPARPHRGKRPWAGIAALAFLCIVGLARAPLAMERAQAVGTVKTVSGEAFVERLGERLPASVGDYLLQGDTLITGKDSSMGVIFRDDTLLSLGPGSRVTIDTFVFDPTQDQLDFLTRVNKGTVQFISGQIAKLRPGAMAVETPLSTIGIRGTRFLIKVD
ncbi:FecR protein [Pseudodesulfovibrio hydrargyri]|uniref:FecR protein n=1 Tax=Pseudodesulfovibrio hydrargyri TaxID=2125990 RepID=A0A1J5MWD0_9BACT|nr:FecR domain-containing protein [Pseudodesulfovibrio hydrargyri]OIQ50274.1 FecR protein [Pseudodesulfovibrio hydrargyri]